MSKSKSKKSTFFWVCVVLAILAVISLIVYLIICNYPESYHHYHKYDCKFRPLKSRSRYHHLNDLFCCENEEEDSMRKMGEVKDEDIIRDSAGNIIPENVKKYYIESKILFQKLQEKAKEATPLQKKTNRTEEEEKKLKAQADAKYIEMLNLDKKVNKTEEDEKKLEQLRKEHQELHDKWQDIWDRVKYGGMTSDEYYKKYEKIKGFLKKIAEYSCAQKSENNKLCIENFMKCGQRCVNVTDEDLIELDKLEKGGDMKKVMEYVKKNILDELNQGDCRTKQDVDSLVEVDGKKVLKEKNATCYEMISNYF